MDISDIRPRFVDRQSNPVEHNDLQAQLFKNSDAQMLGAIRRDHGSELVVEVDYISSVDGGASNPRSVAIRAKSCSD